MYWGAIEIPWNYAIHRIPIFLLPAFIYTVKRGEAYAQDSIHVLFILKWGGGESYSERADVFPQTNISRRKERLFRLTGI